MPVYTPITKASQLPEVGKGFETDVFDMKAQYDTTLVSEIAKDLAGFANHLGGTILIGAYEDKAVICKYGGVTDKQRAKINTNVAHAARNHCHPPVAYSIELLTHSNSNVEVLAINIEPTLSTPIAISDKNKPHFYAFPLRRGSHTTWIAVENLAMHMEPKIRRMYLLLSRISKNASVNLSVKYINAQLAAPADRVRMYTVSLQDNSLTILVGNQERTFPLDRVETVVRLADLHNQENWNILILDTPAHG